MDLSLTAHFSDASLPTCLYSLYSCSAIIFTKSSSAVCKSALVVSLVQSAPPRAHNQGP